MINRIEKIKQALCIGEAALIKSDANRFYLTGFNSSAGIVFITKENAYFLIDFRYFEKAKSVVKHMNVVLLENTFGQLNAICESENIKTVFTECDEIGFNEFFSYKKNFTNSVLLADNKIGELIKNCRSIKSEDEIKHIKEAQKLTDETFNYILNRIDTNRTEKEIALDMEFYMRSLGSEGVSFDFIVVSGKNSSLPHGVPTDKKIQKSDFITMDFGAVCGGYRSDMTRTVAISSITEKQRAVYNTVLSAQNAAFDKIRPGVCCKDIDAAARKFISENGYGGCFGHGLGHSVGIEIHESPCFNTRDGTVTESGQVITVEPGIYIENEFGVRIEDMVLITDKGFENLTKSTKELVIL